MSTKQMGAYQCNVGAYLKNSGEREGVLTGEGAFNEE